MTFITVASATLPSVPLDFQGNLRRILESIRLAKARGATLRTGPEVGHAAKIAKNGADSISWKSLDMDVSTTTVSKTPACRKATDSDIQVESDTFFHSWEVLAQILNDPVTKDMLVDVGMGVRHRVSDNSTTLVRMLISLVRMCDTTVVFCSHTKKSSSFDRK